MSQQRKAFRSVTKSLTLANHHVRISAANLSYKTHRYQGTARDPSLCL